MPDARFRIRRLTGVLGAEVFTASGFDAVEPWEVWGWLARYGVLVFRGMENVSSSDFVDFAACLRKAYPGSGVTADPPMLTTITHDARRPPSENIWHSDQSFRVDPPLCALLRPVELPEAGGDTLFADMRWVYTHLPESLRAAVDGLEAQHDIAKHASAEARPGMHEKFPPATHPVVAAHPLTDERFIFVNAAYTTRVLGVSPAEGESLLRYLYAQVNVPECQCRVRWDLGTVVIWDNRHMQHYAVGDYLPAARTMQRVSLPPP